MGCVGFWLFTGRPLFRSRYNPFREPLGSAPSEEMARWRETYKKPLAQLEGARMGSILEFTSRNVARGTEKVVID